MKYTKLIINTDGGSRGNPGPAAIGVDAHSDSESVFQISEPIGDTTNNVAEYSAVIKALQYLLSHNITSDNISFVLDSELVVNQINGIYKIKDFKLIELHHQITSQIAILKSQNLCNEVTFSHVRRHLNKTADALVNRALDSLS